jgi:predicted amidohydrolase
LEAIRGQIRDASIAQCTGVIYPELTITANTLTAMCDGLSDGSWSECNVSMIVAGSRHHTDAEGNRFNVSTVLDGYGNQVGEHKKLFRYSEGVGPHEAIELGSELQVLVMEEGLFAFGICLDFCNMSESPPYLDLDIDYVLVPSCGKESTMKSHVERSTDIMAKLKSRTVVVQQYYREKPEDPGPVGYVLARTGPEVPQLDSLASDTAWNIRVI